MFEFLVFNGLLTRVPKGGFAHHALDGGQLRNSLGRSSPIIDPLNRPHSIHMFGHLDC